MTAGIDLDAYFERIRYVGPRRATIETLRATIARHTEAIPFENLDPLLRRPVRLDAAALEQKLVRGGRGGYCFEQNLLLKHVLEALGFDAIGLAARVLWNAREGAVTPRGHMLLLVVVDDRPYLADAGFGVLTPTAPLLLEPDMEQATPHESFRLVRVGEHFVLQAKILEAWKALYRFDLQEQFLPDYEVTNWYLSNHPSSSFTTGLIAARPAPQGRYTLRDNELAVHHLDGRTDRSVLRSPGELRETLESLFSLTLPDGLELDAVLERLTATRRAA